MTHLSFSVQSDCRINMVDRIGENYILKATMDEFDEFRMKKNMSDEMKYREKVTCFLLSLRNVRI